MTVTNRNYTSEKIKSRSISRKISPLLSAKLTIKICKIVSLHVLLYGCDAWSLTLREGHSRVRLFENRVLRRIFGPRREEMAGGWRCRRNEELHNSYAQPVF
jgi:hypothetical protein